MDACMWFQSSCIILHIVSYRWAHARQIPRPCCCISYRIAGLLSALGQRMYHETADVPIQHMVEALRSHSTSVDGATKRCTTISEQIILYSGASESRIS
ncbi:hypothetical protein PENSPDRAFT_438781 [Peniophora sp. CONT]|nr:hypothetical protein PENSPDRAFT_438781 [Peniophora sp. CONT]